MSSKNEIRVTEAKNLPYGMLLLTFSTGEKRLFDVTTLKGSAFEPLKSENVRETVKVFYGAVAWMDGRIDCAPEYLYENSYEYNTKDMISV